MYFWFDMIVFILKWVNCSACEKSLILTAMQYKTKIDFYELTICWEEQGFLDKNQRKV